MPNGDRFPHPSDMFTEALKKGINRNRRYELISSASRWEGDNHLTIRDLKYRKAKVYAWISEDDVFKRYENISKRNKSLAESLEASKNSYKNLKTKHEFVLSVLKEIGVDTTLIADALKNSK